MKRETSVSKLTRFEFKARMRGAGSLSGASMNKFDCNEVESAYKIVLRTDRCRVRRIRVLRA